MKYELVKPQKDIEPQLKELFTFVLEKGGVNELAHPRTLVEGWHSGVIKIFTKKNNDKITGASIVLVIKDPITPMKYHTIKSLSVNVDDDFKAFIDNALLVYES